MKYNHAYTLAFEIVSNSPTGDDITPAQFAEAIRKRADDLLANRNEMLDAVGAPFNSYPSEVIFEEVQS